MTTEEPLRLREGFELIMTVQGTQLVVNHHQCEICRKGPHPDRPHHAFQPATERLRKARRLWRL